MLTPNPATKSNLILTMHTQNHTQVPDFTEENERFRKNCAEIDALMECYNLSHALEQAYIRLAECCQDAEYQTRFAGRFTEMRVEKGVLIERLLTIHNADVLKFSDAFAPHDGISSFCKGFADFLGEHAKHTDNLEKQQDV